LAKGGEFTSYDLLFTIAGKGEGGPEALGIYNLRVTIYYWGGEGGPFHGLRIIDY